VAAAAGHHRVGFGVEGLKAALAKADRAKLSKARQATFEVMFDLPKGLQNTPPDELTRIARELAVEL
jgi:hypothetical protein